MDRYSFHTVCIYFYRLHFMPSIPFVKDLLLFTLSISHLAYLSLYFLQLPSPTLSCPRSSRFSSSICNTKLCLYLTTAKFDFCTYFLRAAFFSPYQYCFLLLLHHILLIPYQGESLIWCPCGDICSSLSHGRKS